MDKISVFGGTGFVGTEFCATYPQDTLIIPRESNSPQSSNILYLISTTDNYNVFENPFLDIETNLTKLMYVLEGVKEYMRQGDGEVVFTFISSWFSYGSTEQPATEESCCNPKGIYSATKFCSENIVASYCQTFGIRYRILRLANVIGQGDRGVSAKKNALQYLIQKMIANEPIELYYDGEFRRMYIDVRDCVRAIRLAMDMGEINEIYNICNSEPVWFADAIDYAYRRSGSESLFTPQNDVGFHQIVQVKDFVMLGKKLADLGYAPIYDIKNTLDWIVDGYTR
jgi:nucleoside-diphosphate-sugar epimerase